MDLWPLRALALDLNFDAHGVPATVTRPAPDNTPISTTGIWVSQLTEDFPVGTDFQRRQPRRVLALSIDEVPNAPRGTLIVAPLRGEEANRNWSVDGIEEPLRADQIRVIVKQE